MGKGIFITGTDTGVGKTCFTLTLMEALKKQGYRASGMKPVASGGKYIKGKFMNNDAYLIMQHCSEIMDYDLVNPFVFNEPVSPNFAARQTSEIVDIAPILSSYNQLTLVSDYTVVEGVGGWRVSLSDDIKTNELVHELALPVLLVVGLRLGCINHAILTAEAIKSDGITLCGWVSNQVERSYQYKEETRTLLNKELACPNIADFSYMNDINYVEMSKKVDLSHILGFGIK
jgi:dethiobiotin synthetase|tara:strand:+ start:1773 stop:2465 length:693 start_codon:yes stop_codon:yes gene_type:complete